MAVASPTFVLITAVFTFGVLLFFVAKISSGRNWARIIFLLLFLFGLAMALPILHDELIRNPLLGSTSILQDVLQIVALFLLFKPASGVWFKRKTTT
jgi:hypothetical protein